MLENLESRYGPILCNNLKIYIQILTACIGQINKAVLPEKIRQFIIFSKIKYYFVSFKMLSYKTESILKSFLSHLIHRFFCSGFMKGSLKFIIQSDKLFFYQFQIEMSGHSLIGVFPHFFPEYRIG